VKKHRIISLFIFFFIISFFAWNKNSQNDNLNNKAINKTNTTNNNSVKSGNNLWSINTGTVLTWESKKHIETPPPSSNPVINTWSNNQEINKKGYPVKSVIDWDTVKINYNWKNQNIRLIWVDAPESSKTRYWYIECFWKESKSYLTNILAWKNIELEFDASQWDYDKYNRLLAYIRLNWENINKKIIADWYAFEYTYNLPYKYMNEFKQAQKNASQNNLGLWSSTACNWVRSQVWNTSTVKKIDTVISPSLTQNSWYTCWSKKYCKQMTDCDEAEFYLKNCGLTRLDGDWDWVPCESLCK